MQKIFILLILTMVGLQSYAQKSFTLQDAIQFGLTHSNDLKIKSIAINDATAQVKEYKSIGIPKVNGFVSYQHFLAVPSQPIQDFISPSIYNVLFDENVIPRRELGPPESFNFTLFQPNTISSGIEATALLFDGSYFYSIRAAKIYKDLIAQEKAVTERDIRANITKAYAAVLIARENKKVLENNLTNVSQSLREVKALYENGFSESLDVDRMQLSMDNVNIEISRVNQLIAISKNMLKFQMNYPLQEEIELIDDISSILGEMPIGDLVENQTIDFNKRPEYSVINLGQNLNEVDLKRTKAGYLPTARFFANIQANLFRKNLFDSSETGWIPQSALGVSLNIPIYDGGEKSAKIQRIKLNIEKTELEKQTFENVISLEASNARISMLNALQTLESRKRALDISKSIYDKTLIKFREGVGSSLEVTQAESALYQAQGVYINAMYDLLSAKIDLDNATGKI